MTIFVAYTHNQYTNKTSFMRASRGFTLIELMVVITIIAILVAIAAPSMHRMLLSNTVNANVSIFMSDMRFARSEAIRRGSAVVMCRSDSPQDTQPVCGNGTGGEAGWASGWIIFHDLNNSGQDSGIDEVLRVQIPITALTSISETTAKTASTVFSFTPTGRLRSSTQVAQLQFGDAPTYDTTVQRVLCVSFNGRTVLAGDGSHSCGAN